MRGFGSIITTVMGGLIVLTIITTLPRLMSSMQEVAKQATPAPAGPPPPAAPVDMATVAVVGVIALTLCVAIPMGIVLVRRRTTRAMEKRAATARLAGQAELWQRGTQALAETSEALMEFETDPESVYFTRRLLADVNEPATAAFYTAYDTARNLRTESVPADTDIIIKFVDAAKAAQRAFGVADENARRKARLGISHGDHWLTDNERRKLDQAQKLMRQAHDPAVTETAAHNALTKALSLLDTAGAIVPERFTANVTKSIAAVHRRALTS
ncbi:hypothetical protein [Mycobacterium sp. SMC-13]|uniref:hypothetical protein n=1 Tax=Mycobacterium sp. SMC-13 TaxID=3381626 RepID=UPI0038762FFA